MCALRIGQLYFTSCVFQWQHIQSYLNGYVLDIPGGNHDNGVQVIMYPKNNPPSDNQLWHLEHQPDGTLVMISKLHGKALDCGGQTLGSKLIVWDRHSGPHQQWRREGHFIESMSGFMLDIEGNNPSPGAHVHLWTRNNPTSSNQQFEFVSVSFYYFIHHLLDKPPFSNTSPLSQVRGVFFIKCKY